jgi:hypothetical protein
MQPGDSMSYSAGIRAEAPRDDERAAQSRRLALKTAPCHVWNRYLPSHRDSRLNQPRQPGQPDQIYGDRFHQFDPCRGQDDADRKVKAIAGSENSRKR